MSDMQIDPMEFLALLIEDQCTLLDMMSDTSSMGGMMVRISTGVAEAAHDQIAQMSAALDILIDADKTWQPSYETDCAMVYDGNDPEDGDYYRCTTHGFLAMDGAYVCAGYQRRPYDGGH